MPRLSFENGHSRSNPTRFVALLALVIATGVAAIASRAAAQTTTKRVDVFVRDSAGFGVSGAEVAIVHGLNDALAGGVTDERGRATLHIEITAPAQEDYQLVVRKIGFQRDERFFRAIPDSLAFNILLRRVPQELGPVVVSAEQDIKRKAYHIDADVIANSDRVLIDATDILTKLRPDMICGRDCSPLQAAGAVAQNPVRKCPTLAFHPVVVCPPDTSPPSLATNVWVNGRWIRTIAPDEMAMARRTGMLAGLLPGSMTVLSEIKPEHIAEMTYIDEFDNSVGKIGSQGALFIVLKPGVNYEPGKKSYVVAADPKSANANVPAAPAPAALPKYRYRLLGVYDQATGDPIEGASVSDMTTGTKARTTATGTVSLIFLPEGTSPVRISKPGYDDLTLAVDISANSVNPLTLLLPRSPKQP
jgi:hypothetical protein